VRALYFFGSPDIGHAAGGIWRRAHRLKNSRRRAGRAQKNLAWASYCDLLSAPRERERNGEKIHAVYDGRRCQIARYAAKMPPPLPGADAIRRPPVATALKLDRPTRKLLELRRQHLAAFNSGSQHINSTDPQLVDPVTRRVHRSRTSLYFSVFLFHNF